MLKNENKMFVTDRGVSLNSERVEVYAEFRKFEEHKSLEVEMLAHFC